ncbi:MAG: hypothetical protein ACM3KM_02680 [Acidobacteriaceae bacterium]
MTLFEVVAVLSLASGLISARVAKANNRNQTVWFGLGLVLPIIGVALVLGLRKQYPNTFKV